jgi:hypothetical protein
MRVLDFDPRGPAGVCNVRSVFSFEIIPSRFHIACSAEEDNIAAYGFDMIAETQGRRLRVRNHIA